MLSSTAEFMYSELHHAGYLLFKKRQEKHEMIKVSSPGCLTWCSLLRQHCVQPSENVLFSYLLGKLTDQLPLELLVIYKSSAYEMSHSIEFQAKDLHDS